MLLAATVLIAVSYSFPQLEFSSEAENCNELDKKQEFKCHNGYPTTSVLGYFDT